MAASSKVLLEDPTTVSVEEPAAPLAVPVEIPAADSIEARIVAVMAASSKELAAPAAAVSASVSY